MTLTATHLTRRYALATMQGRVTKLVVSPAGRIDASDFFRDYGGMLEADATQVVVTSDLTPEEVLFIGGAYEHETVVH